jgi:hypothetical protein
MEYLPVRFAILSCAASLCMVVARNNKIIEIAATTTIIMMEIIMVSLNLSFIQKPPDKFIDYPKIYN